MKQCPHCGKSLRSEIVLRTCPICEVEYEVKAALYRNDRRQTCGKSFCRSEYRRARWEAKRVVVIDTGRLCKCGCRRPVMAPAYVAHKVLYATKQCRNWYHGVYLRKAKEWTNRGVRNGTNQDDQARLLG